MEEPSRLYAHCPLDRSTAQIRLIRLQPRHALDTIIRCSLHLGDLNSDECHYEALSYEWGPENTGKFSITLDDKEISVSQMGTVYSHASRVVAWLGVESDHKGTASEVATVTEKEMEATLRFIEIHCRGPTIENSRGDFPGKSAEQNDTNSIAYIKEARSTCACLLKLFHLTYWSRLWIIQELVLSRQILVQLGRYNIHWGNLLGFFAKPPSLVSRDKGKFRPWSVWHKLNASTPGKILQQRGDVEWSSTIFKVKENIRSSLFDVFQAYKDAACADVRDKVFGLRSLSLSCCQQASPVDYSQTPAEVCKALLEHYLCGHQDEIASRARYPEFHQMLASAFNIFGFDDVPLKIQSSLNHDLPPFSSYRNATSIIGLECEANGTWFGDFESLYPGEVDSEYVLFQVNNMEFLLASYQTPAQVSKIVKPNPKFGVIKGWVAWNKRSAERLTIPLWVNYSTFKDICKLSFGVCFWCPLQGRDPPYKLDWESSWIKQPWDDEDEEEQPTMASISKSKWGRFAFERLDGILDLN
ncbi:hypothetical protein EG329_007562 [Mollisiaceae sp. DMI_Dod_QoI]|nr:hypothetical protein EG329_007562 [Helotiales sp. DMI_Dod_QoI]